jgi:hypothetical protein
MALCARADFANQIGLDSLFFVQWSRSAALLGVAIHF